jgi:hypothetical protein
MSASATFSAKATTIPRRLGALSRYSMRHDQTHACQHYRSYHNNDYTVGWVCALPAELATAQEMLDEEHLDLELYALDSIGGHKVAGRIGDNPAAAVWTRMQATFKAIRFGLRWALAAV